MGVSVLVGDGTFGWLGFVWLLWRSEISVSLAGDGLDFGLLVIFVGK